MAVFLFSFVPGVRFAATDGTTSAFLSSVLG
jgi:hypothetical protein